MKFILAFITIFCSLTSFSQNIQTIRPEQGYEFMNMNAKVCGKLVTVTRASNEEGEKFTLLNFCADVPNACFTGRVPDKSNLKFPADLKTYANKNVCITGLIHYWEDKPEIIIKEVNQVEISK